METQTPLVATESRSSKPTGRRAARRAVGLSIAASAVTAVTAVTALSCAPPEGSTMPEPSTETESAATPTPPIARREAYVHRMHGEEREDAYHWMRDDAREDPEILAHLRAETAYAEAMMASEAALQETIYEEIVSRIPSDDASVPQLRDGYWYYHRYESGREYPILCRRPGSVDADEQVYLDANERAEGHAYYGLGGVALSRDGRTLAFGEDTLSRRIYTLRFRDLESGEMLPDEIEGTNGGAVFSRDGRVVFYVRREEGTLRAHQVWRHRLGTPVAEDVMVYDEADTEFLVGIRLSRSGEKILIGSYQTLSNEYRAIDADAPESAPVVLLPRRREHEYDIEHAHGRYYIRTNDGARDFRLASAPEGDIGDPSAWRDELPAEEGVLLQRYALFERFLVVSVRRDGLSRLEVIPLGDDAAPDRSASFSVPADDAAFAMQLGSQPPLSSTTLRYHYESMTTPETVFDFDMARRARDQRKRRVVPNFDPADYVAERFDIPAEDGALIPVSLVRRRDLDDSRPQPLLLYGYGAYGHSLDPGFSAARLSLLDRGMIYAIAHVRGGQERGRRWYEEGRLEHKRNTFSDFIAVGEGLVARGLTAPDRLYAMGGSAGGLLVGAVLNMRPDLFGAVVANVPFVDIVSTMLDETIPLTTFEYDEWGNPNERRFYDLMLSYSPYDNVAAVAHPPLLVLTGLHDSQVQYWEPAKWVARLRHRGTGGAPVLFHVNLEAGHGGASGRFRRHRETALTYAFLLREARVHASSDAH